MTPVVAPYNFVFGIGGLPMKRLLVAGIAAAAFLSAPALAQPAPSVFNWTGFYIGVNGGDLSSKTKGVLANFPIDGFMPGSVSVGTASPATDGPTTC
jgi:hypothetical protein